MRKQWSRCLFNKGYYQFGDDIMHWLNALDSSDMTVRDFRSALWHFILESKPNYDKISL